MRFFRVEPKLDPSVVNVMDDQGKVVEITDPDALKNLVNAKNTRLKLQIGVDRYWKAMILQMKLDQARVGKQTNDTSHYVGGLGSNGVYGRNATS